MTDTQKNAIEVALREIKYNIDPNADHSGDETWSLESDADKVSYAVGAISDILAYLK